MTVFEAFRARVFFGDVEQPFDFDRADNQRQPRSSPRKMD